MARLKYHQTILKILGDDHLTADDIYDVMKKKYGRIGIATIYRTLDHLIETKEITKLVGVFDKAYFERNKGPHMHFVDKQAYKIIDVPVTDYSFLPKQEGFSISYADITVYGTVGNTISSGLFEKTTPLEQPPETKKIEENISVIGEEESTTLDPFFSMQDTSGDNEVVVQNEQTIPPADNIDNPEVQEPSISFSEPSEANTSTIGVENTIASAPSDEELAQQEKEEQKKKKRELKNIFRQF